MLSVVLLLFRSRISYTVVPWKSFGPGELFKSSRKVNQEMGIYSVIRVEGGFRVWFPRQTIAVPPYEHIVHYI